MLKTGNEHLKSLRDGRVVYIGNERVDDVTTHPAFKNAARTVAAIYDMKIANPDAMSFEENGELKNPAMTLYVYKDGKKVPLN